MTQRSATVQVIGLVGWLVACFAAATVGGIASANASAFYGALARPAWAPPGWLFAPVWTVLYAAMAFAAWLVWRERPAKPIATALALFLLQLAANALWSWLFFAWKLGGWALAEVVLLWVLIAATIVAFWRIRPLAGVLLLPYLGWVTFAAVLNWSLWAANPGLLR